MHKTEHTLKNTGYFRERLTRTGDKLHDEHYDELSLIFEVATGPA
ncbi:MAG: hypothetical protein OQK46_10230 [Gammaproteobacteria bacterium]|nr:hypothetical protein [Gammaproteobacteria bacterium]